MRILFLGYSNVLRRRILPFIQDLYNIDEVCIAKYSLQDEKNDSSFRFYNSYEEGLKNCNADLIYITAVNSAHYDLAKRSLLSGRHVIIDKPAFINLAEAYELSDLAQRSSLGIAEATVYPYHPLINRTIDKIKTEKLKINNLTVNFSFPPFDSENFRYKKDLGGGAINDLGPYAVSAGRIFFNEKPQKIACTINDLKDDLEISFSLIARYPGNRSMIGNFGFNTEYVNRLCVFGDNFSFEINRIFTPPADSENEIIFKQNNRSSIIKTERSNSFINFINDFTESIKKGDLEKYSHDLILDAELIDQLKNNLL